MTQTVAEVMTPDPVTVEGTDSVAEAARRMAAADAGIVLVVRDGHLAGLLTDRDIAIRLVAPGKDPSTLVAEIVSESAIVTVTPRTPVDEAIRLLRAHAVRRLPVTENGRPVGVLSVGDLAVERNPRSAVADVSAAEGAT